MYAMALVWLVAATAAAPGGPCERAPAHAQPVDVFYRLSVSGDPDLFVPGELYTVSLRGIDSGEGPTPFIAFKIWVEIDDEVALNMSSIGTKSALHDQSLGTFQAHDAQTKLYEQCKPAVDNATAHPKTEIQVTWSAPLDASEQCVRVCARAVHIDDVRSSVLARKLCPSPVAPLTVVHQPPIVEPCCACDEAKYEVTFEGIWSRNIHPREFPPESSRAHFGDVIGASHTAQYRVWQEGRVASAGLRRLADDGATTALEKELKEESEHIRTIIKARGISWQQVAGAGIPSTFAVFRVDAKHHLVSLAAKLAPSPDWIVGVSALELCNANCTWRRSATLPLYPYDAGTDDGIAYTSRRQPTVPAAPVRALGPTWPRDARSPFFSNSGEMRPFARLRLNRLRLYEKSCDAAESGEVVSEAVGEAAAGGWCATHTWGAWGACSVSCGPGRAARQRHYVWPSRALSDGCRVQLTDYRECRGPRMHCRAVSDYEPDPAESSGPCAVSTWSEWSPCEGCGVRARTRQYVAPHAHKRCHVGFRASTVMSQAHPCEAGPCHRPPHLKNSSNFDWFFVDVGSKDCSVSGWGGWGPCSARCGRGRRLRTRLYLARDSRVQHLLTTRLLQQWNRYFAELQNLEMPAVNLTDEDPKLEAVVQEHLDRCQFTLSQQEALCDGDDISCRDTRVPIEVCKQPMMVGPCRNYVERWFFDYPRRMCEPFGYTGCGGNGNNFRSRANCERACQNRTELAATKPTLIEASTKRLKSTPSNQDNEVLQNDEMVFIPEDIDCEVGPWLGWTECHGDCDFAVKLNYRLILKPSKGIGKPCPRVVKSRTCKMAGCRRLMTGNGSVSEVPIPDGMYDD